MPDQGISKRIWNASSHSILGGDVTEFKHVMTECSLCFVSKDMTAVKTVKERAFAH
jgi:hypothetical protein